VPLARTNTYTALPPAAPTGRYDTYVVQKGDSLWSIAAKPEIYGKATRWRRIFDANRDLLKSPDQLKAGMNLKIPREDGAEEEPADEGATFTK
jgi:nucleoid-associated protein YgaU